MDFRNFFNLFFLVVVILLVKTIANKFNKRGNGERFYSNKVTANNYKLRPSLMNGNERLFFERLKVAVGDTYYIYPQLSLGAIFEPINNWNNWPEINKLNKRIDFVLIDKNNQTAKIAIELDGSSHSNYKSFNRDQFVGELFNKFQIPLVRFNNDDYSAEEIKSKLSL